MAEAIYTAEATSSGGGRDGRVRSSDGIIDQDLKMPPALGGPGGATNPEQLFAAAYATCFHGAMRLVAKNKGVKVPDDATIDAAVSLSPDDTSFAISAVITAHLPGLDQAQADELVEGAHQVCPYSKATRGNVDVVLKATV
ncbi:MAG: lipoyl-dependent peroxiredoxin [Pseudonocardiales bacterium]|jgi:osmotically inducible protein OsmC|uniref:organic hydroperoxide resistance protein n=1 Tax=Pseudonocardia sp. TaxID=60912 RepID=UPI00262E4A35|nr:organic hydroperoxide resistance protein [Pseudonocardia sp.]MCW2717305.1 organic hydroperoxide resistance protein [Pseudonocardia sp.]MDT7612683.1 lipoyl-dependent peroxiredoxin [Pseudonocardiales bacterium]MDT7709491.1 lipoyl-dependent peroxiredoxin [Pseudonocardiales bacterium]